MTPVRTAGSGGPAVEVSCEELEKVLIGSDPERFFQIGSELPAQEKSTLIDFLRRSEDIFAWDPYEAPGVDSDLICHHLNVNPAITPKKQPPRHPSKEHADAVREEVAKLKKAGTIKEGYHQISLAAEDQEKTAFVTPVGNYHYKMMPFGLKNAGSTYQRMMTRMFKQQMGKIVEVYIDDMVVKSKLVADHIRDLGEVFRILRKYKLLLNASKCSFGVGSGKFLSYMVTHRGIEVNPDQIRAIHSLQPPRNPKEVQKLTGMIAALSRFISRSADRCRPFFLLLHKWKGFEWTKECALAFQQLKEYLARPPIMSSPDAGEVLFAYIAVASHAVSLVLIREDNGTQRPMYYVSKSLQEAKTGYLPLEKAILAVVQATRKLPHYFQAHTVVVLTQLLLKSVLRSADYTGRIAKWGTILGTFDIRYMPRTAIKGQVLADLVAEFAEPTLEGMEMSGSPSADGKLVSTVSQHEHNRWRAHIDGAANQRGSGVGLVLVSPEGITIEKSLRLGFLATNNEAEYEALLEGMSMIRKLGGTRLIVGQVNGELEVKDERMQGYLARAKHLQTHFSDFRLTHIPKSGNTHADSLATLATSSGQPLPRVILVEDLCRPTTEEPNGVRVHSVGAGTSWMDPLVLFLKHDTLPDDKVEADKIRRKTSRFWLSEDSRLYRRTFSRPYLLCVHPRATELIPEELHEGICGSHTRGKSLSHRVMTLGYWWPSMHKEALEYVKKCHQCQRFGTLHTLISDNGLQFDSKAFREYCNELGIINRYSTPAYPQGNGQAEAFNKIIVNGLKKRLDDAKGRWVKELAHVLWTYRTTPRRSTGETPFSLTYGAEAVIPPEINFPTQRTTAFNPIANNSLLEKILDLLEEKRESAMVHLAYYQQKLKQGYDAKVKPRPLAPGDLVLRKVLGTARNPAWGKLGLNWEVPYRITSVAGIGAYFLEDLNEHVVPRPWNQLKAE
ncbi:uncharacterized protein LOC115981328 [Quercus lobata]|uniref:uncharacterized protein LOC115981328 n=1 Tax=Quercus lobata TaxID=97700 RepID=UPI0012467752|nr:uncharacterized protein LOC115981328 [Quercus lobata]